jgi:hypothetical protein
LKDAHDRIEGLEDKLTAGGVRGVIRDYLRENGATRPDEVVRHVAENAPEQAGSVIDDMRADGEINGFIGPESAGNDAFITLTETGESE